MSERPNYISTVILGVVAVGGSFAGIRVAQEVSNPDHKLPPRNVAEASESFLSLQQEVMIGLGKDSIIDTPLFQHGQRFNIGGTQYTLLLDKKNKADPSIKGYKRTLIVEEASGKLEYTMYEEGNVYEHADPSINKPLGISELNKLAAALKKDFKKWQKEKSIK